jgi:plastocyanin
MAAAITMTMTAAVPALAQGAADDGGGKGGGDGCVGSKVCYIEITRDGFVPADVRIGAGSTVVWKNADERIHAVSIYTRGGTLVFNSTLIRAGDIFQFTFAGNTLGTYEYFDEASSGMGGRITIVPNPGRGSAAAEAIKVDFNSPGSGIKSIFLSRGSVTGVELLPGQKAIRVSLDPGQQAGGGAEGGDTLRVRLDRNLLDSKDAQGNDAPFRVTAIAGEAGSAGDAAMPVNYKEMATPDDRMLEIPVEPGTQTVEVAGSRASTQVLGYDMAVDALNEAQAVTDGYRGSGLKVGEADDLLMQARHAFEAGRYVFARELATEATHVAHTASQTASVASRAMDEAEASIKATKTLGMDVSDAERILVQTREKYSYGGYDEALNMAVQARMAATSRTDQLALFGAIGAASAGVITLYMFLRSKGTRRGGSGSGGGGEFSPPSLAPEQQQQQPPFQKQQHAGGQEEKGEGQLQQMQQVRARLDLDSIFAEKPHLRSDDRQVLRYVVDRGGEVLLAEIRNDFNLPKSTAWRLVKRLEREELVHIVKFGNQNLVRCAENGKDDGSGIEAINADSEELE